MKKLFVSAAIFLSFAVFALTVFYSYFNTTASVDYPYEGEEPDLPPSVQGKVNKEEFMLSRAEGIGLKRGLDKNKPLPDRKLRQKAIAKMEQQQEALASKPESDEKSALLAAWTPIGPAPIPNGQTVGVSTPVSGRVTTIAVHPTNPNIVYVGTAQGGLYRTTNGGTNWTPMLDNAMSLSIGAVTIDTGQPETVYVGTGEGNFSADSFFGVGVYRIDNASSASPIVSGPFNINAREPFDDVFTGRAITKIAVYEFLPGQIYVATARGRGGIGGFSTVGNALPFRGIWRSDNITSANPTFRQIGLFPPGSNGDLDVRDIVLDPLNADLMVAAVTDTNGNGGLYWSREHRSLLLNIQFNRAFAFNGNSTGQVNAELAIHHTNASQPPTIYAATGNGGGVNGGGMVLRSTNHDLFNFTTPGLFTWQPVVTNNFCGLQCFYDIAIAVDPTNANRVYLGGDPSLPFGISTNGGTSFTSSSSGLHVDSHVIAVAPSAPSIIYFGSDGGIYKSVDSGSSWIPLNNSQFSATQFQSIAVHPIDPNFTIGGTQDNGTNFYKPDGTWTRADAGDGGYTLIDRNATDTTNVRMYHTYFNNGSQQGYATVSTTAQARDGGWTQRGCRAANATTNGITCSGAVNFYAPLAQGPGNPNTIYFGTDRLYRSTDAGLNHQLASQNPITQGVPISAIGISPQNDNVRIVGQNNGGIWGTITGTPPPPAQPTLTNLDPTNTVPNNYIARAVIDPNNQNTAYVTLSAFGVVNVWKTTNLNNGVPNWTAAAGSGTNALPQIPVNAFLVDPTNSNTLYAGTDIGVFVSTNGGTNWAPFGTGLPRVAVFDMAITADSKLRIATHGRGMFEMALNASPRISINDVSLNEGITGTTAFNFNVTLSSASPQTVTVNYATANGTATAGSDYVANSGTVIFNSGETSKTVTVQVNGDTTTEPNETFTVNLSNAVNAPILDNQGVGTILNDDSAISINDVSLNEGNTGTTAFTFTVNVTPPSSQAVTVNYATANGTAVAPGDYNAVASTLLVFGAGEASKTVTVQVNGDTTVEPNENFTVTLSNPSNSVISDNIGVGTIVNDDGSQPGISINDVSLNEGNSGTTAFTFTVTLSSASSQPVTVNYATASGTALFPVDFNNVPSTALTFNPGETSKQITVSVNGDTLIEPNETFNVNLSGATNATIADNQGVGTILNDDGCSYSINPTSQSFSVSGGSGNTVQVTAPAGCAWTAVSNSSFADSLSALTNQNGQSGNIEDSENSENNQNNPNRDFITSLTSDIDEMLFSPASVTAVFTNSTPITIPDAGTAAPYPSAITVSGLTGTVTDVNVRLNSFSHTFPEDVALLLVSPDGTRKFILQSDSGGGTDAVNLTYTFDDQAANGIPDDGPMPANNGSVRPSSVGDDDPMPSPAPPLPYSQPASAGTATLNGTFGGINPNGAWSLYVIDYFDGDAGLINGGWSLDITTQGGGAANFITIASGQTGNGNGTVTYSVGQNTTGQARTGTMTIAGQTFTVNQSNTPGGSPTRRAPADFDGDNKTDLSIFRPAPGEWWYLRSSDGGNRTFQFGNSSNKLVPADYTGDGKTDVAFFRPQTSEWFILRSEDNSFFSFPFGTTGDVPVPADFDADGKADVAVYRPSNQTWFILRSTGGVTIESFGIAGDVPVTADYDGDGKSDLAIYRVSLGQWWQSRSSQGVIVYQFGLPTDKPVQGDYTGDGKTDVAFFRPSTNEWFILRSENNSFYSFPFGAAGDVPSPGDYDGDGRTDAAVFRPSNQTWFAQRSTAGTLIQGFGIAGDISLPNAFVP
jgi:hypothetical protein